jgi:hypothetical protein
MIRRLGGALGALAILVLSQSAGAFSYVSGGGTGSGDLIAVWVKNGYELIANLGPISSVHQGVLLSFQVPDEFDLDLSGAKFTALGVPDNDMTYPVDQVPVDPPLFRPNLVLTTGSDPSAIDPFGLGSAQAVLDPAQGGTAWFQLLTAIPSATGSGTDIVVNDPDRLLIRSSYVTSYTSLIGFATDQIANNISVSTAVNVDDTTYTVGFYEVLQTLDFGTGTFGTHVDPLGVLTGDDGSTGTATRCTRARRR